MNARVITASRYGATAGIGQAIADALRTHGVDATAHDVSDVESLDGADMVILGSAVYIGHWLGPAREFAEAHAQELAQMPVWLFSSGPIGDPPKPEEDPVDIAGIVEATQAREHRVFAGRLERRRLRFADRAVVTALRAPEGDFRDWDAIHEWAREIAAQATAVPPRHPAE